MRGTDEIAAEEFDADMHSSGVINSVTVLIMLIIIYEDVFSYQHREVIHDQTCKDFLYHALINIIVSRYCVGLVLLFGTGIVVTMQKWLLAVPNVTLANWKAADLCEDGRLDVFDLCMMKRELLSKL